MSQAIQREAERRGFQIFDATCPLVTKVHVEVSKMRAQGCEIIMIGHEGHPEVEGTMGQVKDGIYLVETEEDVNKLHIAEGTQLAFVTQTTLSVDDASRVIAALKAKFPDIREPKKADICYATQNRQDAVKFMARQVDLVLVVGSPSSSNSNRLREVAEKLGVPAKLIENADSLEKGWFDNVKHIGLTAGASAPEHLVQGVVKRLKEWGALSVRNLEGVEENIAFPMPKGLNPRAGA